MPHRSAFIPPASSPLPYGFFTRQHQPRPPIPSPGPVPKRLCQLPLPPPPSLRLRPLPPPPSPPPSRRRRHERGGVGRGRGGPVERHEHIVVPGPEEEADRELAPGGARLRLPRLGAEALRPADDVAVVGRAVEVLDAHAQVERASEGLHLRLVRIKVWVWVRVKVKASVRVGVIGQGQGSGLGSVASGKGEDQGGSAHLRLVGLDPHRLHFARAEGFEAYPLRHHVLVGLPIALQVRKQVVVVVVVVSM